MKVHIKRLRELAEGTTTAANPLALANAISDVALAMADALAEIPACTDCGSQQGAALPRSRKSAKAASTDTAAV